MQKEKRLEQITSVSVQICVIYIKINISMSKDETDTHLKYGQGILIKGFKEKDDIGYLTAKGFADATAKY